MKAVLYSCVYMSNNITVIADGPAFNKNKSIQRTTAEMNFSALSRTIRKTDLS